MASVKKLVPAGTIDLDTMEQVEPTEPIRGKLIEDWREVKKDDRLRIVMEGTVVAVQHLKNRQSASTFTVRTRGGLRTFFPDQEKIVIEKI